MCLYFYRCHFVHSSQEALIHNKNVAAYQARLLQQQQQQHQQSRMKTLSMSTGSDREASSVGSLSPTMTHIQNQSANINCYGDQVSPTNVFSYSFSPSNSPILNEISVSPPPQKNSSSVSAMFVKPNFIEQNSSVSAHCGGVSVMKQIPEDARLPVFNQMSSALDTMSVLTI